MNVNLFNFICLYNIWGEVRWYMMRVVQWQIQLEVIYKPLGHFLILSYSLRAILQNKTYEVIRTFGYYPLPPSMSMWFIDDPLLYLCGILILDLFTISFPLYKLSCSVIFFAVRIECLNFPALLFLPKSMTKIAVRC